MRYLIADLMTELPEANGMDILCRDYRCAEQRDVDIVIREEQYRRERYPDKFLAKDVDYMEAGRIFCREVIRHNGFMLHASAVELDGKAYLFSGPCGTGKSTHTGLWQKEFGERAIVFNDDKPVMRCLDGTWYAYGTPWCGKNYINQNRKVPLAGICFLKQAQENRIRRLSTGEALQNILFQTMRKNFSAEEMSLLLSSLDHLIRRIPVFELENRPEAEAVRLSYETMLRNAKEAGL